MSMPRPVASRSWQDFKAHLLEAVNRWRRDGLPGRWRLLRDLEELEALRKAIPASQTPPSEIFPLLYLATIDDGWGHGLEVIEAAARAAGARTVRLGLLCSAESILAPCAQQPPHILGLTILHGDSEPVVREIVRGLPPTVRIWAGGAVFTWDPDFARRTGIHDIVDDVGVFLQRLSALLP